jgi:histone deacetylase 1/2
MSTRGKQGIVQPRLNPTLLLTHIEPSGYKQAMQQAEWFQAMKTEYDALMTNNTWSLVPLPANRQAIGCKWVFRLKQNADGSVNKHKARLVAKGFHQKQGFDYTETFSPVVKPITIRTVLTLAVTKKWIIRQLDINNAFLNGVLEEEVYMTQPPGFVSADSSLVCKLNKALYGLKQAPRAWFERLRSALVKMQFVPSKCDPSLFTLHTSLHTIFLLVYVDDIIITGSSSDLIQQLIQKLHSEFALKDLGKLDYFLGIEVHHSNSGSLLLTQTKYIRDLLTKANMATANSIASPMASSTKLTKFGSNHVSDPTFFRSIVGGLQYVTVTRPEISYSVNKVCQFLSSPLEDHWKAVKRILRYLQGTLHHGLLIQPAPLNTPLTLTGFCDADWASDPDDRRSTSGACIFLGPNLVSWWAKKQTLVARSSAEAEYRSLALVSAEILWMQSLLKELRIPIKVPQILCDNLSAVSLAHNPVLHSRTKHMELDIFFVREKVINKSLIVTHVPAQDQWADVLTKPLSTPRFLHLRDKLRVFDTLSLKGG